MAAFPLCFGWSPTRWLGFLSYAGSALLCAGSAVRPPSALRRLAVAAALAEAFFAADIVSGWRLDAHDRLAAFFQEHRWYQHRQPFQLVSLLLLALVVLPLGVVISRRLRDRAGARLCACGLLLSAALWLLEVISFHKVDETLYHQIQGTMVIAPLWLLAAGMTAWGIVQDARTMGTRAAA